MILSLPLAAPLAGERQIVAAFESGDRSGWEEERFDGTTHYEIAASDGRQALHAQSQASASGLYREVEIDLEETPYLNWRWRVPDVLEGLDETRQSGDDYVARVYVVSSGGIALWRTRAINYVWSGSQPEGATWENAYADNVVMVAVASGDERTGRWVSHRRNVREDFKALHGFDPGTIEAVAVMTDTDDSGKDAEAWYGDIWFSDQ